MKRLALATLTLVSSALAYTPIQTDLQVALFKASKAWGSEADIRAIRMDRISPCKSPSDLAALTNFKDRTITINSGCRWTRAMLLTAVTHEYGHALAGNPEHSEDKGSVMYPQLGKRRKVRPADVQRAQREIEARAIRPTILIGGLD